MPTPAGITAALTVLADTGMIQPPADEQQAQSRVTSWTSLIDPSMTDQALADAIREIASGRTPVYGQVKPQDVNAAAARARSARVQAWTQRHAVPAEGSSPFEQSAYRRGFIRAIGDGADEVLADQHGRSAAAMALRVATKEPDTSLHSILERMDAATAQGLAPWASQLPPPRDAGALEPAPADARARERARRVLADLERTNRNRSANASSS